MVRGLVLVLVLVWSGLVWCACRQPTHRPWARRQIRMCLVLASWTSLPSKQKDATLMKLLLARYLF